MSRRRRAWLVVVAAAVVSLVVFGWIAQGVVVAGFSDLERADAKERLQPVTSALDADLTAQLASTRAYAEQPDAALLLRGHRTALDPWRGPPAVLRDAEVDALLFLDGLGRPVLTATDGRALPLAPARRLRDDTLRVSETGELVVRGLLTSEDGDVELTSLAGAVFGLRIPAAPFATTDGGTPCPEPPVGTLVDR